MSAQAVDTLGGTARQRTRIVTALTEQFVVHETAPDTFEVAMVDDGTLGRWHTVDTRDDRHLCEDVRFNLAAGERCKHRLAVAFHEGTRAIPAWVTERDRLAPGLRPRFDQQRG